MADETKKQTVLRQLEFPVDTYTEAEDIMNQENKRLGYVTRKEKINLKGFLPVLVQDGLDYRSGHVYVPHNVDLSGDQRVALSNAKAALKTFNESI